MRKFRLVGLVGRPQAGAAHQERIGKFAANGTETAASLLAAGLDARTPELASATPLQRAAAEGHVDIVHQLLKHGADVNHQDSLHGNSALHEAAWRGYSQTATILCRQRASVNAVNRAGFTPLHLCCQNGHNETCRVLLLADANPDAKNHYGDTPLHTSGRYGHAGVMRILISAQCNVAEQNKNGDTSLHIAAAMGRRKLTRILLSAACPTNVKNKQGEYAIDIARRKEFHEIVNMLQKPSAVASGHRSKSKSSKREKADSAASSREGSSRNSAKRKDRKRRKEKHGNRTNGHVMSPYGCHANPELAKKLHPKKLSSLPSEPLKQGEQYFLDLAGNIQKGPVGVQTCFCGPVLHRLECRLAKDKQDILQRLDTAHMRLDAKIDGLERKTQLQLQSLQRTVDSLGLESSAAGLQRVRNSIVMADAGHSTPTLPHIDLTSESTTSHSRLDSDASDARKNLKVHHQQKQSDEMQYTLDKLGLDIGHHDACNKQPGLHALRNRLAMSRIREQMELDAIVEHYERRSHQNGSAEAEEEPDEEEEDSEESEDDEISSNGMPPPTISSQKASMLSDSSKPLPSYVVPPAMANGGYRNLTTLPLPRYHLDPPVGPEANGTTTAEIHTKADPKLLGVVVDPVLYARHFAGDMRYQDDRDRHNDSGYSTRPGESSQGPSPSLSGPAESMEGDPMMSPRTARRSEIFQSHFARDLAQTLPTTNTNGYQNGNGVGPYPRVRFAVPNEHENFFPPGTISSSSLV